MKGTFEGKRTDSADPPFGGEKRSDNFLRSGLGKKGRARKRSRLSGRPRYVPLGPLGPDPLKAIPLKATSESGRPPVAARFPLGDMKEDFVSRHLEPVAEFFVLIHPMSLKDLLEKFEIEVIRNALTREKGNVKKAARFLDIKYTTLHAKVKRYAIEPVRFDVSSY
jgi:hypothetical protein